jgi:hypothetical protein
MWSSPVERRIGAASVGAWHTCGQASDKLNGGNNFNRNELLERSYVNLKYKKINML